MKDELRLTCFLQALRHLVEHILDLELVKPCSTMFSVLVPKEACLNVQAILLVLRTVPTLRMLVFDAQVSICYDYYGIIIRYFIHFVIANRSLH